MDYQSSELIIPVKNEILVYGDDQSIAKVAAGNKLKVFKYSEKLRLSIGDKEFVAFEFSLLPYDETKIIKIDDKKYRGRIVISNVNSEIKFVNHIGIEDYVKGVMTKEMPVGIGTENFQALKAFSICIRTYAFNKINENKDFFDIYPDTRDQVYGGVDGETEYTNKIVDETRGQILVYNNQPATIFYHSTCGGHTEDVANVFSNKDITYLTGVEDGNEPYCIISPRYQWTEKYSELTFIDRLYIAKIIDSRDYTITDLNIISRFDSGRVNELEITLNDSDDNEKTIIIKGNQIRTIIRSSDGKSILNSTLFDINIIDQKNILIDGKGYGHGVGLCQWGSIGQSKKGIDYLEILNQYFPGTSLKSIYD